MQLRYYQSEAIAEVRAALNRGVKSPLVCLPTGSGKSPALCTLLHKLTTKRPNDAFMVLVHTKELVEQLADTYGKISGTIPAIYSASVGKRNTGPVVIGQVQSVYKRMHDFIPKQGTIPLVIVDECDRIAPDGEGQYRKAFASLNLINPDYRCVGFTATPYRLGTGLIYGDDRQFSELVYDAPIPKLIREGFLSSLIGREGDHVDTAGLHVRAGEYIQAEVEALMEIDVRVKTAVAKILSYHDIRAGCLVFASSKKHATMIQQEFATKGYNFPIVSADTPDKERDSIIADIKARRLWCAININVLSVGFDAPHIDLIALMRPTASPGLYYQQCGRGLRVCDGKSNCIILDFAGNILKHGPIDTLNDRIAASIKKKGTGEAPQKICEQCAAILHASIRKCPHCGFDFPPTEVVKHEGDAHHLSPISTGSTAPIPVSRMEIMYRRMKGKATDYFQAVVISYYSENAIKPFVSDLLVLDAPPGHAGGQYWFQKSRQVFREMCVNPDSQGNHIVVEDGVIKLSDVNNSRSRLTSAQSVVTMRACFRQPTAIILGPLSGGQPTVGVRHYE